MPHGSVAGVDRLLELLVDRMLVGEQVVELVLEQRRIARCVVWATPEDGLTVVVDGDHGLDRVHDAVEDGRLDADRDVVLGDQVLRRGCPPCRPGG